MESPAFGAAEQFIEGTIAAALVALWLLAVALHLARPYMLADAQVHPPLGADLWWTIYVGMRDVFLLQVFLGSFIFFYPDVVKNNDLPITGGLAAVCAFGVLLLKLMTRADANARSFNAQTFLIGLGAGLYLVPYLLGSQVTTVGSSISNQLASILVSSQNQTSPWPCATSRPSCRGHGSDRRRLQPPPCLARPSKADAGLPASPRRRARRSRWISKPLVQGTEYWIILSVAAVLPILWSFTLALHFARPYIVRYLQGLTLRFGGDVWWLSYVLMRDGLLVVMTLALSAIFLFPNIY
jgi:hypothetical protein